MKYFTFIAGLYFIVYALIMWTDFWGLITNKYGKISSVHLWRKKVAVF